MTAECKRLSPDHAGPSCSCAGGACALDVEIVPLDEPSMEDYPPTPAEIEEGGPQPRPVVKIIDGVVDTAAARGRKA